MEQNRSLTREKAKAIRKLAKNRKNIENLAKSFTYDESISFQNNMNSFFNILTAFLNLRDENIIRSLNGFLKLDKNIPIEVNFKPLKAEHIELLLQSWVGLCSYNSETLNQDLLVSNHRNILFKQVLLEQKTTIDEYFQTISSKERLKSVDLYQLLVNILSNYYLYEYKSDSEIFFDKINSFQTFLDIVSRFERSDFRMIHDKKISEMQYIYRFQFQCLVQFWENQNPELSLLTEKKKGSIQVEIQTFKLSTQSVETQTQKNVLSFENIINKASRDLNKLTERVSNKTELEAIQRIYQKLRIQKIQLYSYEEKHKQSRVLIEQEVQDQSIYLTFKGNEHSKRKNILQVNELNEQKPSFLSDKTEQVFKDRQAIDVNFESKVEQKPIQAIHNKVIQNIFYHYAIGRQMIMNDFQRFLEELGFTSSKKSDFISEMIKKGILYDNKPLNLNKFVLALDRIMKIDHKLTFKIIEQFLSFITVPKPFKGTILIGSPKSQIYLRSPQSRYNYSDFTQSERPKLFMSSYHKRY